MGIELAFASAAMIVAFVGFYTVFVQSGTALSSDSARSALGLPADDRGLTIGDGDGFVVTDGEVSDAADGSPALDQTVTTGPDGTPVDAPADGVLPSGDTPGDTSPGLPGEGPGASVGAGEGEEGTETSLPPSSTTDPGSSSTSVPGTTSGTSEPESPGTTPSTPPTTNPGILDALIDLLGL
jgi:hypothetical protein